MEHMRGDIRDYFLLFQDAERRLNDSAVRRELRNVLIRKYVAAAQAPSSDGGSTWCLKEILFHACSHYTVSTRTVYTALAEAPATTCTTVAASTANR